MAMAIPQQMESMFDEFNEVDTENDKPYFLNAHPLSLLGYLPSDNDDEANCVLCKYINPMHHLEQAPKPRRTSLRKTTSNAPEDPDIVPPLDLTRLFHPRKRTLPGLASSKYNPERDLRRTRVDLAPSAATRSIEREENGEDVRQQLPTGFDGTQANHASVDQHSLSDGSCHGGVEISDILHHASLAGRMVSHAERCLVEEQEASHTSQPAINPAKRNYPRRCHSKPGEEDHHSLEARIRREADTTTLLSRLTRDDDRRGSECHRVSRRAAVRKACPQCQDEQLVSPLLQLEDLPCLHRPLAHTGKRSGYRIQQAEEAEILTQLEPQPAPRATKRIKPIAQARCYCGRSDKGKVMYRCRNEECFVGWFHDQCLRATRDDRKMPWRKGMWYCNYCDPAKPHPSKKEDWYALSFSKEQINEAFGFGFGHTDTERRVGDVYGLHSSSIEE